MSKYVVNPRDEQFLFSHLLYHEKDLYDKAINPSGHDDMPRWLNLGNTQIMRNSLRNT